MMVLYSNENERTITSYKNMDKTNIMSERSQAQKITRCMVPFKLKHRQTNL